LQEWNDDAFLFLHQQFEVVLQLQIAAVFHSSARGDRVLCGAHPSLLSVKVWFLSQLMQERALGYLPQMQLATVALDGVHIDDRDFRGVHRNLSGGQSMAFLQHAAYGKKALLHSNVAGLQRVQPMNNAAIVNDGDSG
jgi:hypothetical protein